jgi:DNA-binding transcriptional ArsR family regulator
MGTDPDDDLPAMLRVDTAAQLKALGHDLRIELVTLLGQRAATVSELAEVVGSPVGTVGHHLGVLGDAVLVRVVRTEQIRGITAKWYRRTAATFVFDDTDSERPIARDVDAWRRHVLPHPRPEALGSSFEGVRFARIPDERLDEWRQRLIELSAEFGTQPLGGERVWALALSLYEADRPSLPDDPPEGGETPHGTST